MSKKETLLLILVIQTSYANTEGYAPLKFKASKAIKDINAFSFRDANSMHVISGKTMRLMSIGLSMNHPAPGRQMKMEMNLAETSTLDILEVNEISKPMVMTSHDGYFQLICIMNNALVNTYHGTLERVSKKSGRDQIPSTNAPFLQTDRVPLTVVKDPWKGDHYRLLILSRVYSFEISTEYKVTD